MGCLQHFSTRTLSGSELFLFVIFFNVIRFRTATSREHARRRSPLLPPVESWFVRNVIFRKTRTMLSSFRHRGIVYTEIVPNKSDRDPSGQQRNIHTNVHEKRCCYCWARFVFAQDVFSLLSSLLSTTEKRRLVSFVY